MEQNDKEPINQVEDNMESNNEPTMEPTNSENEEVVIDQPVDYEAKIAGLNDKYLRLYSEFDNYRKRTMKEKSEILRSAGEDVFKVFLPTIDDFERAIKANETVEDATPIKEGMSLIYNKFKAAYTSKGLEAMNTIGNVFDADLMESITSIPAPSDDLKGKVVDEVEKGYKLGDKVIRFAKVVVGS